MSSKHHASARRSPKRAAIVLAGLTAAIGATVAAPPGIAQAAPPASGYGFVWADQPTTTSYIPHGSYQANSMGRTNTIRRLSTGSYVVTMPGLGSAGGNVQATAYGPSGANRCKVSSWASNVADLNIAIECRNGTTMADTTFTEIYAHDSGAKWNEKGYVRADQSTVAAYTPSRSFQYNSKGGVNTVRRSSTGRYTVSFPNFTRVGGNVQVTGFGAGSSFCKVVSWSAATVDVACFTTTGVAFDAPFSCSQQGRARHEPAEHRRRLSLGQRGDEQPVVCAALDLPVGDLPDRGHHRPQGRHGRL